MDHTRSSPWGHRPRAWTVLASLALAAAACDRAGAPPTAGAGRTQAEAAPAGPVCGGADVHTRHVNVGFPCSACHPAGGQVGFAAPYTFARGTTTAGGVLVRTPGAPPTCTVGCHAPLGAAPHAVTWDAPGPLACTSCHDVATLPPAHPAVLASMTRADCQLCHDVSAHTRGTVQLLGHGAAWMDRASAGFHAFSADRGLSSCQACHGAALDGGAAQVGCARCHDRTAADGSPIPWATNCTMCHGGGTDQTGAPPRAIWGHADDPIRAGAHAAHVAGGPLAAPLDCATCHVEPADALSPGHVDLVPGGAAPLASVVFSGLAVDGGLLSPTWSRADATCSATWCHGAGLSGGSNTVPSWIGGPGQAACGTCHGLPPPAPHPRADGGLARCSACHGFTVDPTGAVIPAALGGKHLSGAVEATGHPATWMDTASAGFHAYSADAGLDTCQACHGVALDGVGPRGTVPVGCGQCHDRVVDGVTVPWTARCTMCHGGTDSQTGAPPRAQWGRGGDPIRVGAHTRHLAGSALAAPIACGACHAVPASPFDAGHITTSPTAAVTFSGVAARGPTPAWSRATATCTTYCHGTTLTGGTNRAPLWTGGPAQAACGTCHGLPPTSGKHWHATEELAACWECHGRNYGNGADGKVDLGLHVDGQIYLDVNIRTWDPVTRRCTSICHGARTW